VTAATLRVEPAGLTDRGRSGGDAQERAATNPVAALPCARIPLPGPLSTPLLHPLLEPSAATVGPYQPAEGLFGLVRGSDPGRSRAKTARDRPGSLQLWRATRLRLCAGAFLSGRPPTNPVGGLPPGNPGHRRRPGYAGWSDG
jgi:hypothetical protein